MNVPQFFVVHWLSYVLFTSFSLFILAIFLWEIIKLIFIAKSQDVYVNFYINWSVRKILDSF